MGLSNGRPSNKNSLLLMGNHKKVPPIWPGAEPGSLPSSSVSPGILHPSFWKGRFKVLCFWVGYPGQFKCHLLERPIRNCLGDLHDWCFACGFALAQLQKRASPKARGLCFVLVVQLAKLVTGSPWGALPAPSLSKRVGSPKRKDLFWPMLVFANRKSIFRLDPHLWNHPWFEQRML